MQSFSLISSIIAARKRGNAQTFMVALWIWFLRSRWFSLCLMGEGGRFFLLFFELLLMKIGKIGSELLNQAAINWLNRAKADWKKSPPDHIFTPINMRIQMTDYHSSYRSQLISSYVDFFENMRVFIGILDSWRTITLGFIDELIKFYWISLSQPDRSSICNLLVAKNFPQVFK